MVRFESDPEERLVVTFPMVDKIAITVLCVLYPLSYVVYRAMSGISLRGIVGSIIFLLISLFFSTVILRTRVVVRRKGIIETFFITKGIELPTDDLNIIRRGPIVCLIANDPSFEYRFPKGLAHGDKLEKALDLFFNGDPEDAPIKR